MNKFIERINDVIQDLEDARSKCLALGLDTMALRLHESVNTMLDIKEAAALVVVSPRPTYNNSGEIEQMVIKQLMENANEQG